MLESYQEQLGVEVYVPKAGDTFDPELQFSINASDGKLVARCVRPGFRFQESVLVTAAVEVAD